MKLLLFFLSFLANQLINAQNTISSYSDEKLPADLVTAIRVLTIVNFEGFTKSRTAPMKYKEKNIFARYDVSYSGGYISGTLDLLKIVDEKQEIITSFDIKLPFRYCCSHNPSHCASTREEIKKNQEKNTCTGWKRAEVD